MKKVKVTYKVYQFDELSEEAKLKATNAEIENIMELEYQDLTTNQKKAVDEAEEMLTPWFTAEYLWEYAGEEVEDLCRMNDYLEDGSYFWEGECGQFETEEVNEV